ncbi:MAG: iron ABC transporter permease [Lachnospiraceae bacterium]|nr:iron ABC transporter permease [Lachnospiraceae bacterium]
MKTRKHIFVICLGFGALALSILLSIAFGAKSIALSEVIDFFAGREIDGFTENVIRGRIPRTVFGIFAGMALGVSGTLMQAITRNPIADPSILGVNTGASLFVVIGMAFFHISSGVEYVLFAFVGAMVTAIFVYGIASTGYGGATPMKLALAGAACSTALGALVNTIMMPDSRVMEQFRFWQVGSISGTGWGEIRQVIIYFIIGMILAFGLAPALNAMALGDEVATSLGVKVKIVRGIATFAGVLLCAAVTAFAGPIGFVGLMIPHLMRLLLGEDYRLVLPMSAVGGGILLLCSDVIGRIVGRPGELEVGVITALLGAPFFIGVVRKAKVGRA